MYAVFDANNFYVSCERVMQPRLQKVPLVVANPGGIVLARSNEAKALGIKMAEPLFKIQDIIEEKKIHVAETRFALYTDLSSRIATILHQNFAEVEEYSIDESFVHFSSRVTEQELLDKCSAVKARILQWVGIPVSVGIAPTKTLAKVAVKLAKKEEIGVKLLSKGADIKEVLTNFPIGDIWGVGRALGKKLPAYGVTTAAQLAEKDPLQIRKQFSVTLSYTINELNGVSCFTAATSPKPAQSLMCTESYHTEVGEIEDLRGNLKRLTQRVGRQLRKQREVAGVMGVFTRGNRFHKEKGYLSAQAITTFAPATADTADFLRFIDDSISKVFPYGAKVKRAGVFLYNLVPESERQIGLFEEVGSVNQQKKRMAQETIDRIERKWGKKPEPFLVVRV